MKELSSVAVLLVWIMGVVIAKGFWTTFFAVTIPFYAMYLVVERVATMFGII